jgi:hypothetical protein
MKLEKFGTESPATRQPRAKGGEEAPPEVKPPEQTNRFIRRLEAERKLAIEDILPQEHIDEELCFAARAKATTRLCREAQEMIAYAKRNYPKEVWLRKDYYPLKSWINNPKIALVLKKYPKAYRDSKLQ